MKLSNQSGFVRLALAATLVAAAACGSDSSTGVSAPPAQLRIVNSVFQYTDATSTASKTAPSTIDVLIDSSTTSPGVAAMPASSVAPATVSGYEPLDPSVHTFVARRAGDTGPTSTFFTNLTDSLPYLPHQVFTSATPSTLVIAGIIPVPPAAGAPHTRIPAPSVPFTILTNDPFPPPLVSGAYQARFVVNNAAPFTSVTGTGATLLAYLTPGNTPPTTVTGLTALGGMLYRRASLYFNTNPGTYTLTLTVSTKIVAQTTITLAAGEVRSFVVQSTGYAAVPSPANSIVRSFLDNQY
ncbi:MAG: hypothetical protein ABI194_01610 [Gemmatimonadaceae bacterium]